MVMIIVLPMWMNFLLRTYAWMTILGNEGIINTLLGYIGLGPYKMLNTQGAVVLGMVYDYLPYMVLPLSSVMVKIDKSVLEAAQDLGCNSFKSLFRVVLPLSLPGVMSGITTVSYTHLDVYKRQGSLSSAETSGILSSSAYSNGDFITNTFAYLTDSTDSLLSIIHI